MDERIKHEASPVCNCHALISIYHERIHRRHLSQVCGWKLGLIRLCSEIGGVTWAGSKHKWVWLSIYLDKHSKCLKIIVLWRILRLLQIFLHIAIHSSSACVRYLRRYHLQQTAPFKLPPLTSNNELSAVEAHCFPCHFRPTHFYRRPTGWDIVIIPQ